MQTDLFPKDVGKQLPFHVFKFHNFFDGLIGYENLAAMKAVIDTKTHEITIGKSKIKFFRYFPSSLNFQENTESFVEIETVSDGTFLVEDEINLNSHACVQPGLYQSKGNKALVHIHTQTPRENFTLSKPFDNKHLLVKRDKLKEHLNFPADHLNKNEVKILAKTLKPFKEIFFEEGQKLAFTHHVKHKIETSDNKPIHQKTYKYPYHLREVVSDQIQKMLETGIIRESSSAWTSPIWVVPKKSDNSGVKKYRIVVDYRKLNKITPADRYPIPEISEILDRLGSAQYFSVLDLASGFHQI